MNVNWKKVLLFTLYAGFAPALGNWANSVQDPTIPDIAFNARNVLLPAIPGIIGTLTALFSNPRYKE